SVVFPYTTLFRSSGLLLLLNLWACGQRACVVHTSTGLTLGLSQAVAIMVNDTQQDRTVERAPAAIVLLLEADRLTDQLFTDVDGAASPADLAIAAHAPQGVVVVVIRFAQNAVPAPRDRVVLGRRVIAQRFMRTLFIVEPLEVS